MKIKIYYNKKMKKKKKKKLILETIKMKIKKQN